VTPANARRSPDTDSDTGTGTGTAPLPVHHRPFRSTEMNLLSEELVRAHSRALLAESTDRRLGHELALGRKLARRAERNALRARLHLARLV